ncbi:MAG: histidine phosphatase family protein [Bacteroidota bacterium]
MAKQLFLIRHAKSDWANADLRDFDRPLNNRGRANAGEMAERMRNLQTKPDVVVSSPAVRAFTTAQYFAKTWGINENEIETDANIYEASVKTLLNVVNHFNDKHDTIAVFGHNPGFTDFANYLSNGHIDNMPTCSVVLLTFPFDQWGLISSNTAGILLFDYPKLKT